MSSLTGIIKKISLISDPIDQVSEIVNSVCSTIHVDVCSLYRSNYKNEFVLLASHGLNTHQPVIIPPSKGLVGTVCQTRHPLNIKNAQLHPDFQYFPNTKEEKFNSFCGVPLVRHGEVIGVLTVQGKKAKKISDNYEAFLVTLASQLALIIADIPDNLHSKINENDRFMGVIGSSGIAIGLVKLCDDDHLMSVIDEKSIGIEADIGKWNHLLKATIENINNEKSALGSDISEAISGIFDAYQMLLSDQTLTDKIIEEIHGGHSLITAIKHSIGYFSDVFLAMDDPYLQAKHEDILHLGNKLLQIWKVNRDLDNLKNSENISDLSDSPIVLVGRHISVLDIAKIPLKKLVGIICYDGSALSHTAVLANALGIPTVMGVREIKNLQESEQIIVDGNIGQAIRYPSVNIIKRYECLIIKERSFSTHLDKLQKLKAKTLDGTYIKLLTNTGLLADIMPGVKSGAEGIGLYRTEIPFMIRENFPTEDEQVDVYRHVFQAYPNLPIYVRTLDVGGDKQLPYYPISGEDNPALGWRGIRFILDNVQLLMTQIRAIIRASEGKDNLYILLPMVSSTQELDQFILVLNDACQQLRLEGLKLVRPKLGIMVEVPAAISQIELWRDKIDFISIGSNDLSQYLLALDRNNAQVAKHYDHVHPAVIREISRIATISKQCNLPLSVCGEMASDPIAVLLLIGMGIRSLSMSSSKLPRIKWLIRSINISAAELFFQESILLDDVTNIRALGEGLLGTLKLNELLN